MPNIALGGVGQRMLAGVARKTAGEFFAAVDDVLNGRAPAARGADATSVVASEPTSWVAPAGAATTGRPDFVLGMTVGALAALAGAIVGGVLARRRR